MAAMRSAPLLACLVAGAVAWGCAPGTSAGGRDAGVRDAGGDGGRCGNVQAACCPGGGCRAGARCEREACCVYPGGLGCSVTEQCCSGFECSGGRCCGPTGEACRRSRDCCDGLVCVAGACEPGSSTCGRAGGACCADDVCAADLVCVGAVCSPCGGPAEACCKPPDACDPGLVCDSGTCAAPAACGHEREPCCRDAACLDGLACQSGTCAATVTRACDVSTCGVCTVTDGCGYCASTTSCVPGSAVGPTSGTCSSWVWLQPACDAPPPACSGATCDACTLSSGCGWCETSGTCAAGSSSGPGVGTCARWNWLPSECAAPSSCAAAGCDSCTALPGCGWCASSGACVLGSGAGPSSGSCADYRYYPSQCAVTPPACAATGCAACTALASCGYCETTGGCAPGTSSGPSVGSCAAWRWLSGDCAPAACADVRGTCTSSLDCCGALWCRAGVTFPVRCCVEAGAPCGAPADCCGAMDCVGATCQCRTVGRSCLADRDCCSSTCTAGVCA